MKGDNIILQEFTVIYRIDEGFHDFDFKLRESID